eukprot:scaffold8259_cov143-Cylindrotheca_fusiformis.AAC.12
MKKNYLSAIYTLVINRDVMSGKALAECLSSFQQPESNMSWNEFFVSRTLKSRNPCQLLLDVFLIFNEVWLSCQHVQAGLIGWGEVHNGQLRMRCQQAVSFLKDTCST